ncbi:hypothetical protein ACQ4PT_051374 [Festuca glaucescens]
MTLCQGSRNVSVNYDACLIRYSDTRFFAAVDFTYGFMSSGTAFASASPYAMDMDTMITARSQLMEELAGKAGDWPERFYNYSLPYTDALLGTDVMSGLAQCTRDLAPSECNRCISSYTRLVLQVIPNSTESGRIKGTESGRIKGYSCYLRYQLGAVEITAPPEPATLAMPPSVPAQRPSTSPTSGSKSSSN